MNPTVFAAELGSSSSNSNIQSAACLRRIQFSRMDDFAWSGFCTSGDVAAGGDGLKQHQHQRAASSSVAEAADSGWFDEIYEATTTESYPLFKVSHRRAVSDTLAFIPTDDSRNGRSSSEPHLEQQFRGDQILSVLSEIDPFSRNHQVLSSGTALEAINSQHSPTPSDSNSGNDSLPEYGGAATHGRTESEAQRTAEEESALENPSIDPSVESLDPKRARRIIANRQSAQRSRIRKLQYIAELEKRVNSLQVEVSALSPQVSFLDHQRVLLNVDNNVMKQRIAALVQNVRLKDVHNEALRKEAERLRQLYQQQQFEVHQQFNELDDSLTGFMKNGTKPDENSLSPQLVAEFEGRMVEMRTTKH